MVRSEMPRDFTWTVQLKVVHHVTRGQKRNAKRFQLDSPTGSRASREAWFFGCHHVGRVAQGGCTEMAFPWPQGADWPLELREHAAELTKYLRDMLNRIDRSQDQAVSANLVRTMIIKLREGSLDQIKSIKSNRPSQFSTTDICLSLEWRAKRTDLAVDYPLSAHGLDT
jgi:hypothetical protein